MRKSVMSLALVLGVLGGIVSPALAGSKGRRNTALILGGAAAYNLVRGNTEVGLALLGGTAIAYDRYQKARRRERERARVFRVLSGFDRDFDEGYFVYPRRRDLFRRSHPPGWDRGRKVGWHKHHPFFCDDD